MSSSLESALSETGRVRWMSGSLVLAYALLGPVAVIASNATVFVLLITLAAMPVIADQRRLVLGNPLLAIGLAVIAAWIVVSATWAPGMRPLKVPSVIAIMGVGAADLAIASPDSILRRRAASRMPLLPGAFWHWVSWVSNCSATEP